MTGLEELFNTKRKYKPIYKCEYCGKIFTCNLSFNITRSQADSLISDPIGVKPEYRFGVTFHHECGDGYIGRGILIALKETDAQCIPCEPTAPECKMCDYNLVDKNDVTKETIKEPADD